jgi:hypothetical protein
LKNTQKKFGLTICIAIIFLLPAIIGSSYVSADMPVISQQQNVSDPDFQYIAPTITDRGTVINVTSTSDAIDGDTSSAAALLADPGDDGISLREAITATNNAPAVYTIRFSQNLKGAVINVGSMQLPALWGGNTIINGDINSDNQPDIMISGQLNAPGVNPAFEISSSNNTIYAMAIRNFSLGIFYPVPMANGIFQNNIVGKCIMTEMNSGIVLHTQSYITDTNCNWTNIQIYENQMQTSAQGISLGLHFTSGNSLNHVIIVNNTIWGLKGAKGFGIALGAGFWVTSKNNQIVDALIANNTIIGTPEVGLRVSCGDIASGSNSLSCIRMDNNTLNLTVIDSGGYGNPNHGINLMVGDSSSVWYNASYQPVTYPSNNSATNIWIEGNTVSGIAHDGIFISPAWDGAYDDRVNNVFIKNNTVSNVGTRFPAAPASGIKITTGSGQTQNNEISNILIEGNHVNVTGYRFTPIGGGILISGGESGARNSIGRNITIVRNVVYENTSLALNIVGSWGGEDAASASINNTLTDLRVLENNFTSGITNTLNGPYGDLDALKNSIKGISISGGLSNAYGNTVKNVQFEYNTVDGEQNAIALYPNNLQDPTDNSSNNQISDISFAYKFTVEVNKNQYYTNLKTNASISRISYSEAGKAFTIPTNDLANTSRSVTFTVPKTMAFTPSQVISDNIEIPFELTQNSTDLVIHVNCPKGTKTLVIQENPLPTVTPSPTPTSTPTITPTPNPTNQPTSTPTTSPTSNPTTQPTNPSTTQPTQNPTPKPTPTSTPTNTATPTPMPTATVPELPIMAILAMMTATLLVVSLTKRNRPTSE